MIRTISVTAGLVLALCAAGCGAAAGDENPPSDDQPSESKAAPATASQLTTETASVAASTATSGSTGSNQSTSPQATPLESSYCTKCSDSENGGTMVCCTLVPSVVDGKTGFYPKCEARGCSSLDITITRAKIQ